MAKRATVSRRDYSLAACSMECQAAPEGACMNEISTLFVRTDLPLVRILRLPRVLLDTGYSRSTIYLRIAQALWTKPVHLGARSVGWPENEVAALNAARVSGFKESEIRSLVKVLHESRATRNSNDSLAEGAVPIAGHGKP